MSDIFLSHTEVDGQEAIKIASRLEAEGYSTWYYERNAKPGLSYLQQVAEAIGNCQVFMLLISKDSVSSIHVDRELTHAYETKKLLIPLLKDVTFMEFERLKPAWKLALGPAVAEPLINSVDLSIQRLIQTLKAKGVQANQDEDLHLEERKIFVRLRLGPEELVNEIRSSFHSENFKCAYRLLLRDKMGPWVPAIITPVVRGFFVNLREIPEIALLELELVTKGGSWRSDFIAVSTIYIDLWED